MDPSDLWPKQQADQQSSKLYKAVREKNWDEAARAASPDAYGKHRIDSSTGPSSGATPPPAATPDTELKAELDALCDYFSNTIGDIHTRVRYVQYACAIVREGAPDARDKLVELRSQADALG